MSLCEARLRPGDAGFLEAWGEAWSADEPAALLALFAPDAFYADIGSGTSFRGHNEMARFFEHMLKFARDSRIVFHTYAGDGGGFAAEWTWSGTATGRLMLDGELRERSVRPFSVEGVAFCTVDAAGLITSHKDYYDMRAVVRQLGLAGG